ncbi:response regulator [Poseidonocella sedimentorum]|nr:response regulator [Poseidonocella sedimentorum]
MSEPPIAVIVEDEAKIRRVLRNLLEDDGFEVREAEDGATALALLDAAAPALITLDVQLGGESGLDILREIRKVSRVPVIMVTGKDDVIDRIVGLEIGADDYIVKPFHVREVLARVHAVLRRQEGPGNAPAEAGAADPGIALDGLTIHLERLEVLGRDGAPCALTTADFALLKVFLDRPRRALSRDQLMDLIGGAQWSPLDRTIDNQVARLRKKIERDPAQPRLIKTVRGVGYMLAEDVLRPGDQGRSAKSA